MPSPSVIRFARAASRLFGWIYTLAWSASFYAQPILNIRRRSTVGLTIDFPTVNVLGFVFYFLSTCLLFFSPGIRAQYAEWNPISPEPTVRANDVAFAAHAIVLSALTWSMFFPKLWGFEQAAGQRVGKGIAGVIVGCAVAIVWVAACTWIWDAWKGIDMVYTLGYCKLLITVVKYVPQVVMNYRRKSTVGWSIWQVLMDLIGGVLSIAQLVIDSSLQNDWSGILGNPVKFWLGNVSIFFDVIFTAQHYWLYRDAGKEGEDEERRGLMAGDEEGGNR